MKKITIINRFALLLASVTPSVLLSQGPQDPPTITNPLSRINDIPSLITTIVDAVTTIGYYIVVIFIIYAGFLFVTARGDEKKLGTAKQTFLWTVVGATILLGASILSTVIENTVNQVGGGRSSAVEQIHV